MVKDAVPHKSLSLASQAPWQDSSFLIDFKHHALEEQETQDSQADMDDDVNLGDTGLPSPIPWTASPWTPFGGSAMDEDEQPAPRPGLPATCSAADTATCAAASAATSGTNTSGASGTGAKSSSAHHDAAANTLHRARGAATSRAED